MTVIQSQTKKRIESIDILKGFGIFFMIFAHVSILGNPVGAIFKKQ